MKRSKLTDSTRVQKIQAEMTDRALELLQLPPGESAFILDIGCGSGLSGELLDEDGHVWVGVDIAPSMLGEFSFLSFELAKLTRQRSLLSGK